MNGSVKLTDWLLTWPVRLPFWLWDRSGLGKSIAVAYVVLLCASVFALGFAAVDTFLDRQAGQPAPVIVPPTETETPTSTATADDSAQTATPTMTADGGPQTATPTPSPTATTTPIPTETPTVIPSATLTIIPTETPTLIPTETPTLIPTETATETPTETPTLLPTETPTPIPSEMPTEAARAQIVAEAPLRLGPDPRYPVVATVKPDDLLQVYARTEDGLWLQVDPVGFTWIAAEFVALDQDLAAIALAQAIPPLPLNSATAEPAVTVPVRTPTSQAQTVEETPTPYPSGGLGLPVDAWEYQFGAGTLDEASGRWRYLGGAEAGGLDVEFWEERVAFIELRLPPALALPPAEANLFVARLTPADSELIDSYPPEDQPDTLVQIYRSDWLADQFDESLWPDDEAGLFRVHFTLTDERVTGLIFEILADDAREEE